jgi:hypothetical protein
MTTMGRDNQPKDRQKVRLERKIGKRMPYDRLLVVCEGTQTEPNYFNEIRRLYKLSSANIVVLPSKDGTQPQKVVNYAYECCQKNNKWEKVFCVFDRDDHPNFENAIKSAAAKNEQLTNDQGEKIQFYAIPSVPCFELWLYLHFSEITSEVSRFDLLRRLKEYMPAYEKSAEGHFAQTKANLTAAYENAERLARNRNGSKIQNPFTAVDEVVKDLMKLAGHSQRKS